MESIFEELKAGDTTFDQFLVSDSNEIDFLFNETLNNLQDLDVPSGFSNNNSNNNANNPFYHSYQKSKSKTHSRQMSGTAIFGFADHNREFSLNGLDFMKQPISVSPGEILKQQQLQPQSQRVQLPQRQQQPSLLPQQQQQTPTPQQQQHTPNQTQKPSVPSQDILNFNFESEPLLEEDEEDHTFTKLNSSPIKQISTPTKPLPQLSQTQPRTIKQDEYIVTNQNPISYKFPPSPTPIRNDQKIINSYSAKYLQTLQQQQQKQYVDDFEPLLETHLPLQPNLPQQSSQQSPQQIPQQVPQQYSQPSSQIQQQVPQPQPNLTFNTFLPPPTPPQLSNESPEWQSSPEPLSPSPQRSQIHNQQQFDISPLHPSLRQDVNFYTPLYNQQTDYLQQLLSSPFSTQSSSPVKESIQQPPPPQNQPLAQHSQSQQSQFLTPTKPKQILEWSPVISPNSKQSLSKQIKDSSPKRRVKKTSLLPPGELDNYWIGPDENKIYKCTYKNCGKLFTRRYNVRSHIQTHLSDRPFSCKFCIKKFVRQHDLNRHLKGHSEAKLSKCPCGKEFARLDALKKHQERNICVGGIKGLINKPSKKKLIDLDPVTQLKVSNELEPI
ncbi:SWI5 [Candida pseudojiufengensis]|uniref:SWI5 n=1 Tax=Candida pseudojiufengensis TaxID=497109 RepID=UPI0022255CB3|nr:SWI5 [Candida pseudojiufengensis]KAI5962474.1 SWI5 [Candida pseudojiufengensis]